MASAEVVKSRSIRFDFQTSKILAIAIDSLANSSRSEIGQIEFIRYPFSNEKTLTFFTDEGFEIDDSDELVHCNLVHAICTFEIESEFKLIASDQSNGFFFGHTFKSYFDPVIVPGFAIVQLLGTKNS